MEATLDISTLLFYAFACLEGEIWLILLFDWLITECYLELYV